METLSNIGFECILIVCGILYTWYISKQPTLYPLTSVTYKRYAVGVSIILLGIILILNKLHLW